MVRDLALGYRQFGAVDPLARDGPDWSFAMIPRRSLLLADIGNGSAAMACFKSAKSAALSASSRSTVTIYKGTKRRLLCCHFVQGDHRSGLSQRPGERSTPTHRSPGHCFGTSWPFRLQGKRAEMGHPLALTIAASVSETPIPLPAFLGERRCRERTLAKQGGLPDQASPYHRVR
jgi:hypothetical protein